MMLEKTRFAEIVDEDARLTILKSLATAPANIMNETLIDDVLQQHGHDRSRSWVRQQMRYLETVGGVQLNEAGTVLVASITRAGLEHVERKAFLEGVKKPRPQY